MHQGLIEKIILPGNKKYFPTGSRYIERAIRTFDISRGIVPTKIANAGSDYDFAIHESEETMTMKNLHNLVDNNIAKSIFTGNNGNVKFIIPTFCSNVNLQETYQDDMMINFIFLNSQDYDAWQIATEEIIKIAKIKAELVADKTARVSIFQSLVRSAGGSTTSYTDTGSGENIYHANPITMKKPITMYPDKFTINGNSDWDNMLYGGVPEEKVAQYPKPDPKSSL